jgi:RNA polymerase sigma-70 factor (ECF subfamily)
MRIDTPTFVGRVVPPSNDLPELFSGDDSDDVFRDLYAEHCRGVYGLAWQICGARFAGDVTQDVFLSLWSNPDKFDPSRGSLHALLLTMARGKAIDLVRSETARRGRETRTASIDRSYADDSVGELDDEMAAIVVRALDQLPANEKEAISTAFYGRCTYKEAAIVLGQPEGTIKARIRRGMTRMRHELAALK